MSDNNLVTYAVNGLDSRFVTIAKIIRHREPIPTFDTTRSMLLLEESMLNDAEYAPNLPQLCNHFNKGTCKFGDRCKFIHDHRNRAGLQSKNTTGGNISHMSGTPIHN